MKFGSLLKGSVFDGTCCFRIDVDDDLSAKIAIRIWVV